MNFTATTGIRPRSVRAASYSLSGQVGGREDGSAEPYLAAQIQLAFDNPGTVLAAGERSATAST